MNPRIRVCFFLEGENLPFERISEDLRILPTEVRRKDEWPAPSIAAGIAKDSWSLEMPYVESYSVCQPLMELQRLLAGKEDVLVTFCERYNMRVSIALTIHWTCGNHPALYLDRETIRFLASIHADFGIDPYIAYAEDEEDISLE